MKSSPRGPLADSIERYLAHKRSLGKQLTKVGAMLQLLDGYLLNRGVPNERQIASADIEAFIASRPRPSPRSYNGLVGAIRGLLDWMVVHEILPKSPLRSVWKISDDDLERLRYRIGNLALLSPNDNSNRGNDSFKAAKAYYAKSDFTLTKELATISGDDWGEAQIDARQKSLADLALKAWPLKSK